MDLQVYVSKKGTKVVTATNLFLALELPEAQYPKIVKGWINDYYEFADGIRKPILLQDFGKRSNKTSLLKDYFLSVEMAKQIVLASRSKKKLKYAKLLNELQMEADNDEQLSAGQMRMLLEITKAMGLVSCQVNAEKQHLEVYEARNGGNASNWWKFRSKLFGYSNTDLKRRLAAQGKKTNGKSQRQMLMALDKYEMIRTGVIDLFMAMGKTEAYAKQLGDLAKTMATEMQVEIYDDRNADLLRPVFALDSELSTQVQYINEGKYLQFWQAKNCA